MSRRFIATVLLCSIIPVLVACAVIYRTFIGNARQDILNGLVLESEYKAKEIAGYLALKKKTVDLLSGLKMFSVAVEYQRFEGLSRFFDSMMKNERDYLGVCFLNKNREIQANNEFSNDGRYLNENRNNLARYMAAVNFTNEHPWQFVEFDSSLAPVAVSKVYDEFNEHAGYLVVLLNHVYFEELLSTFSEKYKRIHNVDLQYLVSVEVAGKYKPTVRTGGFVPLNSLDDDSRGGTREIGGIVSVWNVHSGSVDVKTCFQAKDAALFAQLRIIRTVFWIVVPLFIVIVSLLVVVIIRHSFQSVEMLLSKMGDMSKGNYSKIDPKRFPSNDKYVSCANRLIDRILAYEEAYRREERLSVLGKLASQVAHDIRSPLAALDAVIKDVSQLPEEKRIIIRSAASRIRDIANNLIEKHREVQAADKNTAAGAPSTAVEPATIQLLSSLIDPLITEKRLQFRSKIGIEIDSRLDASSYGLFAKIQPTEFKRVLSNLINNAVEALGEKGMVTVSLAFDTGQILLKVQDNGKGIPPDILSKLGQKGVTHGKAGGSGLGLYHAMTSLESWGGSLDLDSRPAPQSFGDGDAASGRGRLRGNDEKCGTTVIIKLPKAQPPEWFVSTLELEPNGTIVVLDDDTSIHQVWQGRFSAEGGSAFSGDSLRVKDHGIELFHFSTPQELRIWAQNNSSKVQNTLYLVDYELLGHRETGLVLIENLGLGRQAVLVTSRFEEKGILEECLRLGVRMIPKGLAGFVPITIRSGSLNHPHPALPPQGGGENKVDAVLIDDDPLVHLTWKMAAKAKGHVLKTFKSPKEFLEAGGGQFPRQTTIYLDCELGKGIKGEEFAQELHAKGFTKLYLATGHSADRFQGLPSIKAVVGKEPPWG
ncbi:MAG: sensor histidine kinase [Elusimicrobia bacterium]|nr:sensor histidine kinase [Elusimicrobiota bacterium]